MPEYLARVAFRSQGAGAGPAQLSVNIIHVVAAQLTSPFDASTIASDIDTQMGTQYRACLADYFTWHDLTVTDVTPSAPTLAQHVLSKEVAGTRSGTDNDLSYGLCAVIALKTGIAARYARGRVFAPPAGVSSSVDSNGIWKTSNAYWTNCNAWAAKLQTGWTAGDTDYAPAVFSPTRVARSEDPSYWSIESAVVRPQQHFLRSRTRGSI